MTVCNLKASPGAHLIFRVQKFLLLSALSVFLWSCSSLPATCSIDLTKARTFPQIDDLKPRDLGRAYYFDGLFYQEFEDSGLLPSTFASEKTLQDQKFNAYCVRWATSCINRPNWKGSLFHLKAIVVYTSETGQAYELGNQCRLGTLEIQKIASILPYRLED